MGRARTPIGALVRRSGKEGLEKRDDEEKSGDGEDPVEVPNLVGEEKSGEAVERGGSRRWGAEERDPLRRSRSACRRLAEGAHSTLIFSTDRAAGEEAYKKPFGLTSNGGKQSWNTILITNN